MAFRKLTRSVGLPLLVTVLWLCTGGGNAVYGQQMYQLSQYMFNNYIVNPAVAGTYNFFQIRTNHRFQWVGLRDAPMTNAVSVYGPHAKLPMGFGGLFYSDITGPSSRFGLQASYAYNFPLTSEIRFSAGLSLGAAVYRMDGSKFSLGDNTNLADDPALLNYASKTTATPDASVGFYLYASHFFVGLSAHQLIPMRLPFYSNSIRGNRLLPHIYVNASYLIFLYETFELEPGIILRYGLPTEFLFDVNIKMTYQGTVWWGLGYRFMDAVSAMIGYIHDGKFFIGYSFDFSYTTLRKHSYGTHELMLGYQFDKIK